MDRAKLHKRTCTRPNCSNHRRTASTPFTNANREKFRTKQKFFNPRRWGSRFNTASRTYFNSSPCFPWTLCFPRDWIYRGLTLKIYPFWCTPFPFWPTRLVWYRARPTPCSTCGRWTSSRRNSARSRGARIAARRYQVKLTLRKWKAKTRIQSMQF